MPPLPTGTHLGNYEILGLLGVGGMGEVYRAHDAKLNRDVAIKILPSKQTHDAGARARFELEARAVAALNHPHIVTIYNVEERDGVDFIVMELVTGRPLNQLIPGAGLPVDRAMEYGRQIAQALDAAHRANIVHRDLKPSNVMVSDAGQVKVLDFGLAKLIPSSDAATLTAAHPETAIGAVLGTVAYMSPEQAEGRAVDARSDIFSFGAVLYEMLSGRRAFAGETAAATLTSVLAARPAAISSIRTNVPTNLQRLATACLQRDPALRPTASDVERTLTVLAAPAAQKRRVPTWARGLAAVGLLAVVVAGAWLWKRNANAATVRSSVVPEMRRLMSDGRTYEAFLYARAALPIASGDPDFSALWRELTRPASLESDPPGAEVAISPYERGPDHWMTLGQTTLAHFDPPAIAFQLRVSKPGYAVYEDVLNPWQITPRMTISLVREQDTPPDMVRAAALSTAVGLSIIPGSDLQSFSFPAFWIDRSEVTNREYKKFVDAGGYERRDLWTQPITKNGHTLSWDESRALFRDATGRPGPATWQGGTYPAGQDDFPVTGVSWYEAHAYLTFAGKQMLTLPHWVRVADFGGVSHTLLRANFGGRGPVAVGTTRALSRFGTQDLAGNVKEWVANPAGGDLRYIAGGGWDEPPYMYDLSDARPALQRAANFGIRGARFDPDDHSYDTLGGSIATPRRDYTNERPVATPVFEAYRRLFAYDRTPVVASAPTVRDTHPDWRIETVTFPAVYGNETIIAHVFLPKRGTPPFQTIVWVTGSSQYAMKSSQADLEAPLFAAVVRSGRAVVMPIVKGAFERSSDRFTPQTIREGALWREYAVGYQQDVTRTLDYLETRADVDHDRVGYMGLSRGASLSPLVLSLEPTRVKTAVLMIPGMYLMHPGPEVDIINFLPHVTQPVLMLSGRFDFLFPEKDAQLPFFNWLGTSSDKKKRVVYDSGHNLPAAESTRETLDWLDKTLGAVKR
jgi:dienelactone hydrolase